MVIRIHCPCGNGGRMTEEDAKHALRELDRKAPPHLRGSCYAYGDHVRDPRAFAMRLAKLTGWEWNGGELGKTTITMECPSCVDARRAAEAEAEITAG